MLGVVASYQTRTGYGFLRAGRDFFFHIRDVITGAEEELTEGAVVTFIVGRNAKGICARDIVIVKAGAPVPRPWLPAGSAGLEEGTG